MRTPKVCSGWAFLKRGRPAGNVQEDRDCLMSTWTHWSNCSASCYGLGLEQSEGCAAPLGEESSSLPSTQDSSSASAASSSRAVAAAAGAVLSTGWVLSVLVLLVGHTAAVGAQIPMSSLQHWRNHGHATDHRTTPCRLLDTSLISCCMRAFLQPCLL